MVDFVCAYLRTSSTQLVEFVCPVLSSGDLASPGENVPALSAMPCLVGS